MAFVQFYDPATQLDRLFGDALAARFCSRACSPLTEAKHVTQRHGDVFRPRMDLHESKDDNTVKVAFELPGLTSKDIAIDVQRDRLTVSGEFVSSDAQEERSYAVRERRSGKFSRTLQLPFGTQPDDVVAKMENGVLTITFPKTNPEQQAKRIVVQ